MQCFACNNPATQQCHRCGKLYCDAHGDNLCAECLSPVSAAPSPTIFRGSLLALLAGTVVAIWLLVRPPELPGEGEVEQLAELPTPTATAEELAPTVTVVPPGETVEPLETPTPVVTPTPTPTATGTAPAGEGTETPTPTPEEGGCPPGTTLEDGNCIYVVQTGDTPGGIAERFGITLEALRNANGLTGDLIQVGQRLIIPV